MRVLLDECVPRRLGAHLAGSEVWTVRDLGRRGLGDELLLRAGSDRFDVFITVDRGVAAIRSIPSWLAIVLIRARSNNLAALLPFVDRIRAAIDVPLRGQVVVLER